MILDARNGPYARSFTVYDAKSCRLVRDAVWVDDQTAQWGRYNYQDPFELSIDTVQEERITIYLSKKLVVFNEVEDNEPVESLTETEGVPA